MKPIMIHRGTEKTCMTFKYLCGTAAPIKEVPHIRIRRAGTRRHVLEYPGEMQADGRLCFHWGELFFSLEPGRYIGDVYAGRRPLGYLAFQLHPQLLRLETESASE